jgi:hypothetical protein
MSAVKGQPAVGPDTLKTRITNLWWGGRYADAAVAGSEYRRRYGSDLHVDYQTGTSACRVREYRAWGHAYLELALQAHGGRLSQRQRATIALEIGKCGPAWGPVVIAYYQHTPAVSHVIGTSGASWTPAGMAPPVEEEIDPEGEDLRTIEMQAIVSQHSIDTLLRTELPSPNVVEVAPCGDFCGEDGGGSPAPR